MEEYIGSFRHNSGAYGSMTTSWVLEYD